MKKDKNTPKDTQKPQVSEANEIESAKVESDPTDTSRHESVEEKSDTLKPKEDVDALLLSAIESTEVVASDEDHAKDPDQEVTIIRPPKRTTWWKRRKILIPAGIIALLIVLFAVPLTRYAMLGWVWHKDVVVTVLDSRTGNGLKAATVAIGSSSAETDAAGIATVKSVPLGNHDIAVQKTNYKKTVQATTVDIFSSDKQQVKLAATGTVVSLVVTDKVSGVGVADADVKSGEASVGKTNKDGAVELVMPVSKKQLPITVTAPSYNVLTSEVTEKTSKLSLTPTGNLYFLSKQSGKLDVVKTNIDGADRKIVVPGTGSEDDGATSLIVSSDWKYAVLKAKRASNKVAGLYLVTTTNDTYTVFDDANVDFTPVGWSGHFFLYKTTRSSEQWRAGSMQLKSFNAETGKSIVLDQNESDPGSTSMNAAYELPGAAYIVDGRVVYTKSWTMYGSTPLSNEGKQASIRSVKPDGSDKKLIKSFPVATVSYVQSRLHRPQGVYFQVASQDNPQKYSYSELVGSSYRENATLTADFSTNYPIYNLSPNGEATLWSEERDGKHALFFGDKNADNKQELAAKSDFKAYGWLTDTMILLQKNDSELYVTTKDQLKKGNDPVKVSNYHRVTGVLSGYGYGL